MAESRYYTDWYVGPDTITVVESDDAPRFSGLLDKHGRKLMVKIERDPIGFVRFQKGKENER